MPPTSRQKKRTADSIEVGSGKGRGAKRSCNACSRCRRQKIKCSGTQPCDACKKRKLSCEFDARDQKILVTRGYILDLQQKLARYEAGDANGCGTPGSVDAGAELDRTYDDFDVDVRSYKSDDPTILPGTDSKDLIIDEPPSRGSVDLVASSLTNPLSSQPAFMITDDGRTYHFGTSSNWSFTRRVLNVTHEHVYHRPVPTSTLLFDGAAYDLGWDGSRLSLGADAPPLPSLDHAIYLINAVKFHCGQMFHLFDEETFMARLYDFYADATTPKAETEDMWYIQLLIILAFGKAFVGKKTPDKRPPGADLFMRALQLLPCFTQHWDDPMIVIETLCCVSLYLQCLDFRHCAHNYIGQALRLALSEGMHMDMPVQHLGEAIAERRRRVWWTTYVLDREMTSLMGLPQAIHDEDMCPQLPTYSGSIQRSAALGMQVKLSRMIAAINGAIYGADGRLHRRFLSSTKKVLARMAGLADELQHTFPIHLDKTYSGLSRSSASLHLLYHQCIVLATRPLLFCFLKIRYESPGTYYETLSSSQSVWNLLKMCIESSQQMVNILTGLQSQGLLETFLPFDLESLFVSTVNLLLGPALDPQLLENRSFWLHKAYGVFNDLVAAGNRVAEFRKSELLQLDGLLTCVQSQNPSPSNENHVSQHAEQLHENHLPDSLLEPSLLMMNPQAQGNEILPSPISGVLDEVSFETGLTAAQILDMANSIETSDTDWMSHTMMEHSIW